MIFIMKALVLLYCCITISIFPFCAIKLEKEQDELALFKLQKHTETENVDQLIIILYT